MKKIRAVCTGLLLFVLMAVSAFAAGTSYRSQLQASEAGIYDTILENLENRESSFTHTFSPFLEFDEGDEAQKELQRMTFRAYEAFYRDHPEIFWVNKSGGLSVQPELSMSGGYCRANGIIIKASFTDESNIAQKQQKLESALSTLIGQAGGSEYERLAAVHDYLVNNCTYNMKAKASASRYPDAYESYGALVDGSAVCEGYAKAMKMACDRMGIPCVLIGGNANGEDHMWNYVQLDGGWYLLDATFDDPVGGSPTRDYFLKGSASTAASHKPGGGFLQGFKSGLKDPTLSEKDYTPGQRSSSSQTASEGEPDFHRVTFNSSQGGSYEVKLSGSTTGGIDNGQRIADGAVLAVTALPRDGYALGEIYVDFGDKYISETVKKRVLFKVTDDCTITVTFKEKE